MHQSLDQLQHTCNMKIYEVCHVHINSSIIYRCVEANELIWMYGDVWIWMCVGDGYGDGDGVSSDMDV